MSKLKNIEKYKIFIKIIESPYESRSNIWAYKRWKRRHTQLTTETSVSAKRNQDLQLQLYPPTHLYPISAVAQYLYTFTPIPRGIATSGRRGVTPPRNIRKMVSHFMSPDVKVSKIPIKWRKNFKIFKKKSENFINPEKIHRSFQNPEDLTTLYLKHEFIS